MPFRRVVFSLFLASLMLVMAPDLSHAKKKNKGETKDRVARDFRHGDDDGDEQLSPAEWNRRGNFERLDRNGDGFLSLKEVRRMYKGHDDKSYDWPPQNMPPRTGDIDPTVKSDRVDKSVLDDETRCGIGRSKKCDIASQKARGLFETGTGPRFPSHALCPGADDYWAMDYASKRNNAAFHGGIDLPVPWGTPMRAAAAGSVVAKYGADNSKRGMELILRHSPKQTGLPMWTYTGYGHLDALPDLKIGQRVKMGEIIGPTGNSGISAKGTQQSTTRRPAIHFVVFYADTPQYAQARDTIVPVEGRWMDPMAFYRQTGPFDTPSVKALPDSEKDVDIPVLFEDGAAFPANTKLVWPYACKRD